MLSAAKALAYLLIKEIIRKHSRPANQESVVRDLVIQEHMCLALVWRRFLLHLVCVSLLGIEECVQTHLLKGLSNEGVWLYSSVSLLVSQGL